MTAPVGGAVVGVEMRLVELPLRRKHVAAHGVETARRVAVVCLVDAEGHSGWGECSALSSPGYSDEHTAGAWRELCTSLAPAVVAGRPLPDGAGPMARAAVTAAAAVLDAERAGRSLAVLLAREASLASPRAVVQSTAVVAVEGQVDVLLGEVQFALDAGHRHVKLKIHPGWDLEPLGAVRAAWPTLWLAADANGSYGAVPEQVRELARFDLAYVEQPLRPDDLLGHVDLVRGGGPAVALDESVTSIGVLREIAHLGAADAVNLKLSRLGGPRAAVAALVTARELGLDVWCGGMLETGVGRAVALAVAAQHSFTLPTDLGPSERYFAEDLVEPVAVLDGSEVVVPTAVGLGGSVRRERLDSVTVERWVGGELGGSQ